MAPIFDTILLQVLKSAESDKGLTYENTGSKKEGGFSLGSDSEDEG